MIDSTKIKFIFSPILSEVFDSAVPSLNREVNLKRVSHSFDYFLKKSDLVWDMDGQEEQPLRSQPSVLVRFFRTISVVSEPLSWAKWPGNVSSLAEVPKLPRRLDTPHSRQVDCQWNHTSHLHGQSYLSSGTLHTLILTGTPNPVAPGFPMATFSPSPPSSYRLLGHVFALRSSLVSL